MAEPLPGYIAADVEVSHELVERLSAKYGISVDDFRLALNDNGIAVVDVQVMTPSVDGGSDWFTEPTRKRLTEIVEPDDA